MHQVVGNLANNPLCSSLFIGVNPVISGLHPKLSTWQRTSKALTRSWTPSVRARRRRDPPRPWRMLCPPDPPAGSPPSASRSHLSCRPALSSLPEVDFCHFWGLDHFSGTLYTFGAWTILVALKKFTGTFGPSHPKLALSILDRAIRSYLFEKGPPFGVPGMDRARDFPQERV